ncbi:hypothetical protein E8E14_013272 [Neopestalotiopsis sp. 37M]|nr:hypothetical protein E8E14_013272 [Neopestalotiopsis sp. 37M]
MSICTDATFTQKLQTAIIQGHGSEDSPKGAVPLVISHKVAVPALASPHHVRIRVLAVALNHCDYKMVKSFPTPECMAGCDFCGIVVEGGAEATVGFGQRVCGAVFPNGRQNATDEPGTHSGAFAQFVVADSRLLLRVPDAWSDAEGAALGGVGWCTVALALSSQDALALPAWPSQPAEDKLPVLVYGAATATGTMACQLLMLSGFRPIAVTSPQSADLAIAYGASATASYTSPRSVESIKQGAGTPIRHALDCITTAESVAACFSALARTGGRYACVEGLQAAWRTRRAIHVKEVMGYEAFGCRALLGSEDSNSTTYTREANPAALATYALFSADLSFAGNDRTSESSHTLHQPLFVSSDFDPGSLPIPDYTDNGDTDLSYAETEAEDLHQSSNGKTALGAAPPTWASDKRLSHLNFALSSRLDRCPLGIDGSPLLMLPSPSQASGCSVESGPWGSHIMGDILRDTVEFISIIESYTSPRTGLSTGLVKTPPLCTVVQLNLLSVHLQLIATYDRLLKHFCGQLHADDSPSSSATPSTQATAVPSYNLSPFDLPGMEVAGFQVQQGTLQTKILLETILHNLTMVERLLGLPSTWRTTDKPRDPCGVVGVFENKQARLVLEAIGLSTIDWTDGVPDDQSKLPAVASLRDGIKRLQTMIE